ncbi:uncharacterized [Tachysurus ichikawai]
MPLSAGPETPTVRWSCSTVPAHVLARRPTSPCHRAALLLVTYKQQASSCPRARLHIPDLSHLNILITCSHASAASYTGGKERKHRRLRGFSNCHPSLLPFEAQGTKRCQSPPPHSVAPWTAPVIQSRSPAEKLAHFFHPAARVQSITH